MRNAGGVYLSKLRYEVPYAGSSGINVRYKVQDNLIASTIANQDTLSSIKRDSAASEATIFSRYGLALRQYVNFLTGYPEYFQ